MPRPKFRNMFKWDDQEGKDFTFRTRNSHTPQQALSAPNTIKPSPMMPPPPKEDKVGKFIATDEMF